MWLIIGYIRVIIIFYLYGTILLGVVHASASVTKATGVIWDLNHSGICRAAYMCSNISVPRHSNFSSWDLTASEGVFRPKIARRCNIF